MALEIRPLVQLLVPEIWPKHATRTGSQFLSWLPSENPATLACREAPQVQSVMLLAQPLRSS